MRKEINEVKCIIRNNFRFWYYVYGHEYWTQTPNASSDSLGRFLLSKVLPASCSTLLLLLLSFLSWLESKLMHTKPIWFELPSAFQSWLQCHTAKHETWLPEQLPKDQMTQPCVANLGQWETEGVRKLYYLFLPSFNRLLSEAVSPISLLEKSHTQNERTCWETSTSLHSLSPSLATVVTHCINFFLD